MANEKIDKILDVCPLCRFPKRISGYVFIKKSIVDYSYVKDLRCKLCGHLPDYEIVNLKLKEAKIIYRNFNGAIDYFKEVIKFLKERGFKVLNKHRETNRKK